MNTLACNQSLTCTHLVAIGRRGLGRGFRGARRRRRHNRAERAAARQPGAGIVSSVCVGVWMYWAAPCMRVNGLYRYNHSQADKEDREGGQGESRLLNQDQRSVLGVHVLPRHQKHVCRAGATKRKRASSKKGADHRTPVDV